MRLFLFLSVLSIANSYKIGQSLRDFNHQLQRLPPPADLVARECASEELRALVRLGADIAKDFNAGYLLELAETIAEACREALEASFVFDPESPGHWFAVDGSGEVHMSLSDAGVSQDLELFSQQLESIFLRRSTLIFPSVDCGEQFHPEEAETCYEIYAGSKVLIRYLRRFAVLEHQTAVRNRRSALALVDAVSLAKATSPTTLAIASQTQLQKFYLFLEASEPVSNPALSARLRATKMQVEALLGLAISSSPPATAEPTKPVDIDEYASLLRVVLSSRGSLSLRVAVLSLGERRFHLVPTAAHVHDVLMFLEDIHGEVGSVHAKLWSLLRRLSSEPPIFDLGSLYAEWIELRKGALIVLEPCGDCMHLLRAHLPIEEAASADATELLDTAAEIIDMLIFSFETTRATLGEDLETITYAFKFIVQTEPTPASLVPAVIEQLRLIARSEKPLQSLLCEVLAPFDAHATELSGLEATLRDLAMTLYARGNAQASHKTLSDNLDAALQGTGDVISTFRDFIRLSTGSLEDAPDFEMWKLEDNDELLQAALALWPDDGEEADIAEVAEIEAKRKTLKLLFIDCIQVSCTHGALQVPEDAEAVTYHLGAAQRALAMKRKILDDIRTGVPTHDSFTRESLPVWTLVDRGDVERAATADIGEDAGRFLKPLLDKEWVELGLVAVEFNAVQGEIEQAAVEYAMHKVNEITNSRIV